MDSNCPPAPVDKKAYIAAIGKLLIDEHGKEKYYKPKEIKQAVEQSRHLGEGIVDYSC